MCVETACRSTGPLLFSLFTLLCIAGSCDNTIIFCFTDARELDRQLQHEDSRYQDMLAGMVTLPFFGRW